MRLVRPLGAFALLLSASLLAVPAAATAVSPPGSAEVPGGFETCEPVVALTFDDGPSNTAAIVDAVESVGGKATFFVCGKRIGSGRELLDASLHGFEIGNHTWGHVALSGESLADDTWQIERTNDAIEEITGERPAWVRARNGVVDDVGLRAVQDARQRCINWDVHARDTDKSLGPDDIRRNVLRQVHPGAVVLLHATRPATVEALPGLVEALASRGYRLVTVSQLADVAEGRLDPDELPPPRLPESDHRGRAVKRTSLGLLPHRESAR